VALLELYAEEKIEIRVSREKVKMPEYTVLLYRNSYSDEIGLIGRLCVFDGSKNHFCQEFISFINS